MSLLSQIQLPDILCEQTIHALGFPSPFSPVNVIVNPHTWSIAISAPIWLVILIIVILVLLGFTVGRFLFRRRFINQMADRLADVETAFKWRSHETTVALTFWLLIAGIFLFVAGVTGTIELSVPGAKLVTSLPGLAIIYLSYRTWANASKGDLRKPKSD